MDFKQQIDQFIVKGYNNKDEYQLDRLKEVFEYRAFGDHLFVFKMDDYLWMNFAFFQYSGCEIDNDSDKEVNHSGDLFWYGGGPLGSLKELRHSYFTEYVFYASPSFIKLCCDILLEYYEE